MKKGCFRHTKIRPQRKCVRTIGIQPFLQNPGRATNNRNDRMGNIGDEPRCCMQPIDVIIYNIAAIIQSRWQRGCRPAAAVPSRGATSSNKATRMAGPGGLRSVRKDYALDLIHYEIRYCRIWNSRKTGGRGSGCCDRRNGIKNHIADRLGHRQERKVARLELGRLRAHHGGKLTFQVNADDTVFRGNDVPGPA